MAEPVSAGVGVVTGVIYTYKLVTKAYDFCLDINNFPKAYKEFRMGLIIEKTKLELWALSALAEHERQRVVQSPKDLALWKVFEAIFLQMVQAFEESHQRMETLGQQASLPSQNEGLEDWELLQRMTVSIQEPPKKSMFSVFKTGKFVLREKAKIEALIKKLNYWNESLSQMSSSFERQKARRRLRTRLSTNNTTQLKDLEAASDIFDHPDLKRMANARSVIEEANRPGMGPQHVSSSETEKSVGSEFHLRMENLIWHDTPYKTDRPRAMATLDDKPVIVDWRTCSDESWRRQNPDAFHRRTSKLAQILNSNLRPLNLSVLHCEGYLEKNANVTGYAFRIPDGSAPNERPITLGELLSRKHTTKPEDIPDLGERFELARALISTIFEIHNLGWMHKNILPKNVLFWRKVSCKKEWDISHPYLMGFDIARPNQPGEVTEKPAPERGDDIYRHPLYKGDSPRDFQPSFDMYSLGVILYEIGRWQEVTVPKAAQTADRERPNLTKIFSDSTYIDTLLQNGSIRDLRRHTGAKYRDAVEACLKRDFDAYWVEDISPQQAQHLQQTIIDGISSSESARAKTETTPDGQLEPLAKPTTGLSDHDDPALRIDHTEHPSPLQAYLDHVQRTVVDTVALCNA